MVCPDGLPRWSSLFRDHDICRTRGHRHKRRLATACTTGSFLCPVPATLFYPQRPVRSSDRAWFSLDDQTSINQCAKGHNIRHSWSGKGSATPIMETVVLAQQRFATAVTHVVSKRSNVVGRSRCAKDVPPKASPASIVFLAAMASGHDLL